MLCLCPPRAAPRFGHRNGLAPQFLPPPPSLDTLGPVCFLAVLCPKEVACLCFSWGGGRGVSLEFLNAHEWPIPGWPPASSSSESSEESLSLGPSGGKRGQRHHRKGGEAKGHSSCEGVSHSRTHPVQLLDRCCYIRRNADRWRMYQLADVRVSEPFHFSGATKNGDRFNGHHQ